MKIQSSDRRVRKTKHMLRAGLIKLMGEKSIQNITVKELCELCDINRGTFYLHYTDVHDLLNKIETELLNLMEEMLSGYNLLEVKGGETASPVLRLMFGFLKQNSDICRVMLCNNGDLTFVEEVKNVVRRKFMAEWSDKFPDSKSLPSEFVFTFITSGCIGVLQQWIKQDMPQSPDQMAAMVETIIVRGVTALTSV